MVRLSEERLGKDKDHRAPESLAAELGRHARKDLIWAY